MEVLSFKQFIEGKYTDIEKKPEGLVIKPKPIGPPKKQKLSTIEKRPDGLVIKPKRLYQDR